MSHHRLEKVARELQREVSEVLRQEMRDPGLGMVTVTRVQVSRDFQHARVYVSILGSKKQQKKSLAALERARGFVQHHVGRRMSLRQVPALSFVYDESIEGSIRISRLIDRAVATHADAAPASPDEPAGEGGEETTEPGAEAPASAPSADAEAAESEEPEEEEEDIDSLGDAREEIPPP